jgi:CheY-like chemotaxis protein
LLIDDEVALARAVERALSRYHDITISNSGREAIARIVGGERFDVIISDLNMPEVTGMDVHSQLSRLVPDQARRMVFLTGGAFAPGLREFLAAVPNPWLEKPFDLPELLAMVARLL